MEKWTFVKPESPSGDSSFVLVVQNHQISVENKLYFD